MRERTGRPMEWRERRLGWPAATELSAVDQRIWMGPVAAGGAIYRVPLTANEYFLLEYRTRASYYDRDIPAEGVLIWHVRYQPPAAGQQRGYFVDLEGADGRGSDAGYPLGSQADAAAGEDNLDFWAHDAGYAAALAVTALRDLAARSGGSTVATVGRLAVERLDRHREEVARGRVAAIREGGPGCLHRQGAARVGLAERADGSLQRGGRIRVFA